MSKRATTRQIGAIARSFVDEISERKAKGGVELLGIATGFDTVDDFTGGLQSDQFWIVAARTSVGKTAFALDMALHASRHGYGTLFYSLEMRGEILVNRLLSRMTGIPAGRIIRGKLTDPELVLVVEACAVLDTFKLAIIDKTVTSLDIIEESMRVADTTGNVGLVMVDYAGILADRSVHGDVQRLSEISGNLRMLARPDYLDCTVVVLAQLNRQSEMREDHRPALSDIKGSGSFEQDADVVLFPYRPHLYELMKGADAVDEETDAEIIIAKNRNGPMASTKASFYPKLMKWEQKKPKPVEPKLVQPRGRKPVTTTIEEEPQPKPLTLKEQVQRGRKTE